MSVIFTLTPCELINSDRAALGSLVTEGGEVGRGERNQEWRDGVEERGRVGLKVIEAGCNH